VLAAGAAKARPITGNVVATCRELVGIDARTELSAHVKPHDVGAEKTAPSFAADGTVG
jgi:hypothetical protein